MKNSLVFAFMFIFCLSMYAQKSSVIVDLNYRTKMNQSNWGAGLEYMYVFPFNLRLAVDAVYYFPETNGNRLEQSTGLDFDFSVQYLIKLNDKLNFYPIVGAIVTNHKFSFMPIICYDGSVDAPAFDSKLATSVYYTDFGVNIGGGVDYNIGEKYFIKADYKYNFIKKDDYPKYRDYANISLGFGYRF